MSMLPTLNCISCGIHESIHQIKNKPVSFSITFAQNIFMKAGARFVVKVENKRGIYIVYDRLKKRAMQRLVSQLAAQNKVDALNREYEEQLSCAH